MQARIKPDIPLPWILVMRFAAADREGASMHIPVVDVAAFLASLGPAPASFESLNHSATVNPKLREIHRLLGVSVSADVTTWRCSAGGTATLIFVPS